MDKNEALVEFLKALRVVFNTASAYPKDHPYFRKSVEEFKHKADALLVFLNPVKIGIMPDALFVDGKRWEKSAWFTEVAYIFHMRKIKSLEIREGVSIEELVAFLSQTSLPIREFFAQGGLRKVMIKDKSSRISAEELEYSQLLQSEGEEAKDVWACIFSEVVDSKDIAKVNEFTENFGRIMAKFGLDDILNDENLRSNISRFLSYLKSNSRDKFEKCARDLFKSVSRFKHTLDNEKIARIRELFRDFDKETFSSLLLEALSNDDSFDSLSFKLFSRFADDSLHREIALSLPEKAKDDVALKNNPRIAKRIQGLFDSTDNEIVSEVYRNTLNSLFKSMSFEKGLTFDRDCLKQNYRYIILSLFEEEKDPEKLNTLMAALNREWDAILKEGDLFYLTQVSLLMYKIKAEKVPLPPNAKGLEEYITQFIERSIWKKDMPEEFIQLTDSLVSSAHDAAFYINKFFNEDNLNPLGIKMFFRFFPGELDSFIRNLKARASDLEFIERLVAGLKETQSDISKKILMYIYSFSQEYTKFQVIKAMHDFSAPDRDFIFSVMQQNNPHLKREALLVLSRDPVALEEVVRKLLYAPNPLGLRNKVILEHMGIIEELGLQKASAYLKVLSSTPEIYFWYSPVRRKAKQILEKWYAG